MKDGRRDEPNVEPCSRLVGTAGHMRRTALLRVLALGAFATATAPFIACGNGGTGGSGNNGAGGNATEAGGKCTTPAGCYVGLDPTKLVGTVACLTQVPNGYCTHTCTQDSDCCAIAGECPNGKKEVCASFQSTGQMYCFLSCEAADIGTANSSTYCASFANSAFGCRSTGGGSKNRQVCLP